jgi:hypothetical protein
MLTAEGFKTFCYPSVGLVIKTGDHLRLSCDADVLESKQSFNCGNFSFLLPSALCPLPSALPQPRSPKVAKNLNPGSVAINPGSSEIIVANNPGLKKS